ncbi:unnamed protein product [Mesocestoides corti]|uniref:Uncharacterized protein n=1 Tax=Mesocestoides corti TaxID=53468 RepID=A0A158QU83_MESCO|nr:unnamed protein product [Mesocestoides corti]
MDQPLTSGGHYRHYPPADEAGGDSSDMLNSSSVGDDQLSRRRLVTNNSLNLHDSDIDNEGPEGEDDDDGNDLSSVYHLRRQQRRQQRLRRRETSSSACGDTASRRRPPISLSRSSTRVGQSIPPPPSEPPPSLPPCGIDLSSQYSMYPILGPGGFNLAGQQVTASPPTMLPMAGLSLNYMTPGGIMNPADGNQQLLQMQQAALLHQQQHQQQQQQQQLHQRLVSANAVAAMGVAGNPYLQHEYIPQDLEGFYKIDNSIVVECIPYLASRYRQRLRPTPTSPLTTPSSERSSVFFFFRVSEIAMTAVARVRAHVLHTHATSSHGPTILGRAAPTARSGGGGGSGRREDEMSSGDSAPAAAYLRESHPAIVLPSSQRGERTRALIGALQPSIARVHTAINASSPHPAKTESRPLTGFATVGRPVRTSSLNHPQMTLPHHQPLQELGLISSAALIQAHAAAQAQAQANATQSAGGSGSVVYENSYNSFQRQVLPRAHCSRSTSIQCPIRSLPFRFSRRIHVHIFLCYDQFTPLDVKAQFRLNPISPERQLGKLESPASVAASDGPGKISYSMLDDKLMKAAKREYAENFSVSPPQSEEVV